MDKNYPLTGVADHGVSEALYLSDPDENGLELYWDKPREQWPLNKDGGIEMYTHTLDVFDLLSELKK
jgi:catechol 2,3-dioxygenase